MLPGGTANVYFEAAGVIVTLILAGRYLEARAKGRTGEAIRHLAGLRAKSARLLRDGKAEDVPLESVVRFGDPVAQILDEAEAFGADLIVVSTAGRSGIGRVLLGSVAERVFARATAPVMLVRPRAMTLN